MESRTVVAEFLGILEDYVATRYGAPESAERY